MDDDIIKAGIILMVYMFIILVAYFILSTPFDNVVTGLNNSTSVAQVPTYVGYVRTAFDLSFALAGLIPAIWFVSWVFKREPDRPYWGA